MILKWRVKLETQEIIDNINLLIFELKENGIKLYDEDNYDRYLDNVQYYPEDNDALFYTEILSSEEIMEREEKKSGR